MSAIRTPRTTEQAIDLIERHAAAQAALAAIEGNRARALADTNAVADALAMPVIEEMTAIAATLEAWWAKAGPALTGGKRKSVELGGCRIGTVTGRSSLTIAVDAAKVLADMRNLRWTKPYIRIRHEIDKVAVRKGLGGKHGAGLALLGFAEIPGAETFFVERIAAGAAETVAR